MVRGKINEYHNRATHAGNRRRVIYAGRPLKAGANPRYYPDDPHIFARRFDRAGPNASGPSLAARPWRSFSGDPAALDPRPI
jgi:hypothetical protein